MRTKTLSAIAVASTFAWATVAHAGSDRHASSTGNEAYYPSTVMFDSDGMGTLESSAAAALADGMYSEYYLVSWSPSSASEWDNYVILEPSSSDLLVLLDDGASTVSMHELLPSNPDTIVLFDGAMYELMPASSDMLVLLDDEAYMLSTYDVILLPSDFTQGGGGS